MSERLGHATDTAQMTKPTGWDTGLSQDYHRGLALWFASRLGARHTIRRWFGEQRKDMDNEKLMNRLAALPAPDFMHAHKLSDPIGSGSSYRADTVARLIDEAVTAERERCIAAIRAVQVGYDRKYGPGPTIEASVCSDCIGAINAPKA